MKNLNEFGTAWTYTSPVKDMSEIMDKPVIVMEYQTANGEHGEYAAMLISYNSEQFVVTCGGVAIMKKLALAKAAEAFPVSATFTNVVSKTGREYLDVI